MIYLIFGEIMESLVKCSSCTYRHLNVLALEEKESSRYSLQVEKVEDMLNRIVRSSQATVKVPELGIKITPGLEAEG
jgi:zinc finger protein